MRSRIYIPLFIFILVCSPAFGYVVTQSRFDTLGEGGWSFGHENPMQCVGYGTISSAPHFELVSDPAPGTTGTSGRIKFIEGMHDGYYTTVSDYIASPEIPEFYWTLWWKASAGYTFHSTDNKLLYIQWYDEAGFSPNFYFSVKAWGYQPRLVCQGCNGSTYAFSPNQGNDVDTQANTWYKYTIHAKMNTDGQSNGIIELWINDVLHTQYTNVKFKRDGYPNTNFRIFEFGPIFGGYNPGDCTGNSACCKLKDEYFYVDESTLSTTSDTGTDTTPPTISNRSPDSGETGWLVANENVSFDVSDGSGVDSSTLRVDIIPGGTNFSCSSGLSCTPSGDPVTLSVVYDRGSPWAYSTTYTVDVTSVYDVAPSPNEQSASWQFTTEAYVPTDTTDPTLSSSTPSSGQTGWALNDWQVVFDITDAGDVDDSTLQFNVDGGATKTCGAGLSCTYVIPKTLLRATYNRGSDWACGTTYSANIPQVKDVSGNTLSTSWNFTTVDCAPEGVPGGDFNIHIHED